MDRLMAVFFDDILTTVAVGVVLLVALLIILYLEGR